MDKKTLKGIGIGCAISLLIALIAGGAFIAGGALVKWNREPTVGLFGQDTRQQDNPNYALQFDGDDDYVDLGNWFNYSTFTIAMWVKPEASQVTHADIIDNNHTDYRSWVVQQDKDDTNRYCWGVKGASSCIFFSLTPNTWQHLVLTRDEEGVEKAYINGLLIGTDSGSSSVTYDGTQLLSLARWGYGGRNWKGQMDEVQIWNIAITSQQIKDYMQHPPIGTESGLIAYYHFDEGNGIIANDSSRHKHEGKLINGPVWVMTQLFK